MFAVKLLPTGLFRCVARLNVLRAFTARESLRRGNANLPPRIHVKEEDIEENFIKGGGAGGQKINKTNSQVQLIHHPTGIHVRCQETRSRAQNRTIARRILAERIEELEKGDQSRTALKAQRAIKKKANATKKKRRKYRKLDEERAAAAAADAPAQDRGREESTIEPCSKD